MVKMVT